MFKYILKDLMGAMCWIPSGFLVGILSYLFLLFANRIRIKKEKTPHRALAGAFLFTYFSIILIITIFSRQAGTVYDVDLNLFTSWNLNLRNRAYVIENILLFVPYGIFATLGIRRADNLWTIFAIGTITSGLIEALQLLSGRGIFQLEDIVTNIVGTIIGYCLVALGRKIFSHKA